MSDEGARGETLAQKILARAAGKSRVEPGDLIWADVDLAMMQDSGGPRRVQEHLERLGVGVWDPDKITVVADHFTPGMDVSESRILQITRDWVKRYGVRRYHEAEGICHIVPGERGYVLPGTFMVGGDSHSNTAGAYGCFATALGSTDMLGVLVTGKTWIRVPETIRINWDGKLPDGVMAKDMILYNIGKMGGDAATYMAVEFGGSTIATLNLDERLVLPNMTTELGAKAGMIEPDELIFEHLRQQNAGPYTPLYADPDAAYVRVEQCDASNLEPMLAAPYQPDNVYPVAEVAADGIPIDQAYIGACTGAKYHDLWMAARVLKGRRVAPGTRLLVAPASVRALQHAEQDGIVATLLEAGAIILPSGCGACAGLSMGVLGPGQRCISSTNRNFPGRMGDLTAEVYLASPASVAAAAVAGRIVDPREYLN